MKAGWLELWYQQKINTRTLVPVPIYRMYEEQAKELDKVSARINKIVDAMRVFGSCDLTVMGRPPAAANDPHSANAPLHPTAAD